MRSHLTLSLSGLVFIACAAPPDLGEPDAAVDSGMDGTDGGAVDAGAHDGGSEPSPVNLSGLDCDPLVPLQCGFPFPSNVYLEADPTSATGRRVAFGPATLPVANGSHIDPSLWHRSDGFSSGQAPLTYLPGATSTGLPTPLTIEQSTQSTCPTVLLDTSTGQRIPHWVEIDASVVDGSPAGEHTFMIRPAVRLKDATRYIVALRHVVDTRGAEIQPSPTFLALRDGLIAPMISVNGSIMSDPTVEPRRPLYADIFDRLSSAGVSKSDLQLAWDYTTASRANNTAELVQLRDAALTVVGTDGPSYTIPSGPMSLPNGSTIMGVTVDPNASIALRIEGLMRVPLYLTAQDPPQSPSDPRSRLVRDANGAPMQSGFADYPFIVQIPKSVAQAPVPAPIVQAGHGLLGTRNEGRDGYLATFSNEGGYVTFAVDLTGFDHNAIQAMVVSTGGDLSAFADLVEAQHQGLVNEFLAMRMISGAFARDSRFYFNDQGQLDPSGHSVIDPSRRFYRGDSWGGGCMGATYMALSTDVTRGALGAAGMPMNLLLNRSIDFGGYLALLDETFTARGGRDIQLVLGLMQMLWDRTEANGYAPYIASNPLAGTPSHVVLLSDAIGDFQVSPFGTHILARAIGASNLEPLNREVYGVPGAAGPLTTSALVEYDFHLDLNTQVTLPLENIANNGPAMCDPHDEWRTEYPSRAQIDHFFKTGEIQAFCSGASLLSPSGSHSPGSCDFDASTGPMTPPTTPLACGPG